MKLGITREEAVRLHRDADSTAATNRLAEELLQAIENRIRDYAARGCTAVYLFFPISDKDEFKGLFHPENELLQKLVIDAIKGAGFSVDTTYENRHLVSVKISWIDMEN